MISKIPEYTLMLNKYTMHTELLNRIMAKFNEKNLKDIGELEMLLTTGVTDEGDKPDSKKIYNMVLAALKNTQQLDGDERLRLIALLLNNMNMKRDMRTPLEAFLQDPRDKQALLNLAYLGVDFSEPSSGGTKGRLSDAHKAQAKKKQKDEKYGLSRYTLPLEEILDNYLAGKLDKNFQSVTMP